MIQVLKIDGDKYAFPNLRMHNQGSRLMMKLELATFENSLPKFSSLADLERTLFTMSFSRIQKPFSRIQTCDLVRASNLISCQTKRGPGSLLVCNPKNSALVPSELPFNIPPEFNENCPEDRMLLFYSGRSISDNVFLALDFENNFYLWVRPDQENQVCSAFEYTVLLELGENKNENT